MSLPEPASILKILLAEAGNSRRLPWRRDFSSTVRGDFVGSVGSGDMSAKPFQALMEISKPLTFLPLTFFLLLSPVSAYSEEQRTKVETLEPPPTQDAPSLTLTQIAERGDARAQFVLGVMYAIGDDVPQDHGEAAKWFWLAAEQGHAEAQNCLGVMYVRGEGVPHDYKEAYAWFNIVAAKGHEIAVENRNISANMLDPRTRSEAQAPSHQYYKQLK